MIHQRRRETCQQFCQQLETQDYSKTLRCISKIKKGRSSKPTFTVTEGPQAAADTMAGHLESIFSGSALSRTLPHMDADLLASPFSDEPPFTTSHIIEAIQSLPKRKAPGVDHLRVETLQPIQAFVAPLLLSLFQLCWKWSYTPKNWRIAEIILIHKKGSPSEPTNYPPISLTSTFRKILEHCLKQPMQLQAPQLDIAQGGFRCSRCSLDQAL
jgi:hypothetical protein